MKLALLVLAFQPAGQQFDLICSGTMQAISSTRPGPVPFSSRYKVDLDRRLFCEEPCIVQWEIAAVHPTVLTLMNHHWHEDGGGRDVVIVNRESGEYRMERTTGSGEDRLGLVGRGTCTAAPFTGLPTPRTAF